ncbi:hypothetical protein LEMLEM_LOCUS540, partial [Lemmus lemmus]
IKEFTCLGEKHDSLLTEKTQISLFGAETRETSHPRPHPGPGFPAPCLGLAYGAESWERNRDGVSCLQTSPRVPCACAQPLRTTPASNGECPTPASLTVSSNSRDSPLSSRQPSGVLRDGGTTPNRVFKATVVPFAGIHLRFFSPWLNLRLVWSGTIPAR